MTTIITTPGVYAHAHDRRLRAAGTFKDKPALTKALNEALLHWEKVPAISLFLENTAAFVHELPPDALARRAVRTPTCA